MTTLYTIGHSNRPLDEFMRLLGQASIQTLVDVRARPQSKHNPQFNEDSLRSACEAAGIMYHWAGRQLGGMRKASGDSPHIALDAGLRGYADYMQTPDFERAASQLINPGRKAPVAFMCAEKDPLQCHRSLISDYLLLQGVEVVHLIDNDKQQPHMLRPEARRESTALIYDRNVTGELDI
ncbi:MAG: DUF488 domain-containing protein [Granulosicoccaceae bacterium]|jgi:uncharacterized protein (DUF488 family)